MFNIQHSMFNFQLEMHLALKIEYCTLYIENSF